MAAVNTTDILIDVWRNKTNEFLSQIFSVRYCIMVNGEILVVLLCVESSKVDFSCNLSLLTAPFHRIVAGRFSFVILQTER